MCLSPEFFDGREALVRKREAEGDILFEPGDEKPEPGKGLRRCSTLIKC